MSGTLSFVHLCKPDVLIPGKYRISCFLCCCCRQLCVVSGEKAKVEKYSSVGLDGAMVIWDFKVHVSNFNTKMKL